MTNIWLAIKISCVKIAPKMSEFTCHLWKFSNIKIGNKKQADIPIQNSNIILTNFVNLTQKN